MPTLKELMGDKTRGDGRKFAFKGWAENKWFEPIFWASNGWVGIDESGEDHNYSEDYSNWHEWTPPKQTKKVQLYRPIRKYHDGIYHVSDTWESEKKAEREHTSDIVGWQEMEIEVTE